MDEKLVVVLDTNVFISGLLSPVRAPGLILRRFRQGDFTIATSREQIREIQAVLRRPSLERALPKGTPKEVLRFLRLFKKLTKLFRPKRLKWDFEDAGDHFLLDLCVEATASFLVTGDRALQNLKVVNGTLIVSPGEFLAGL